MRSMSTDTTENTRDPQTRDGFRITTLEQDGRYAGEDVGRLWFKTPGRGNVWTWFGGFEDDADHRGALATAQTMTMHDFDVWFLARQSAGEKHATHTGFVERGT